jgi:hypothetical protein
MLDRRQSGPRFASTSRQARRSCLRTALVFEDLTHDKAPAGVDVILVAPKGSGTTVCFLFLEGRGINASVAVHQDASGKNMEKP